MATRPSEAERGRRTLSTGILVFRWAALVWMVVLALTSTVGFSRPASAWSALALAAAWTVLLTVSGAGETAAVRWMDLALASGLILVSGYVVPQGEVSRVPFLATAYPVAAILVWGAARGPLGGLASAAVLGTAMALSRPVNGVALGSLGAAEVQALASTVAIFAMTGLTVGVVARLLERSAHEVRAAGEAAMAAREEAARLAERESLARTIHDSVLQALALIHKRGRELGERDVIPGVEARRLADMAGEQERELRSLVVRPPSAPLRGMVSLREQVEASAREVRELPVEVSATGPVWLSAAAAGEMVAAVRQALENAVRHAGATRVTIHLDREGGQVVVSVRDDGRGFVYDEEALRGAGKLGLVASVKGRIEDLGGEVRIETAPGAGTEVELSVPVEEAG